MKLENKVRCIGLGMMLVSTSLIGKSFYDLFQMPIPPKEYLNLLKNIEITNQRIKYLKQEIPDFMNTPELQSYLEKNPEYVKLKENEELREAFIFEKEKEERTHPEYQSQIEQIKKGIDKILPLNLLLTLPLSVGITGLFSSKLVARLLKKK